MERAFRLRVERAAAAKKRDLVPPTTNGDNERYPDKLAAYAKGLPHDARGLVDPKAFKALTDAIASGRPADFEAVPTAGGLRQVNPQAALSYGLDGVESCQIPVDIPPAFNSAEQGAEACELYWQALTRDVPFAEYERDLLVHRAAQELTTLSGFRGPRIGGAVTPATAFRGSHRGTRSGPTCPSSSGRRRRTARSACSSTCGRCAPASTTWSATRTGSPSRTERPILRASGPRIATSARLTDYGAFVELEPGVEGLIHVSEMSWSKRVKHPSKILNVGDSVEAMVLGVDPTARRISLGLKQVESNPWHELGEKYPVGTKIKGKVRNLTEFGAFVEVEEDIDGLIHISDMSWSKRVKHPSEVLKKGDVVDAMVLSIDAENQRLSLGLKQLATDIWDDFFSRHNVNDLIAGKVTRMTNFGAFVELDEGIEGLIHVSEFDDSHGGEKIDLQVGNTYQMKIIKLSPQERKIGLSIRALKSDEYRADWEAYQDGEGTGTATLGDHFRNR